MADTLTLGLVQQTNRQGREATNLLASFSGTYRTQFRCYFCGDTRNRADDFLAGHIYRCPDCDDYDETYPDEDPPRCYSCENDDGVRMEQIDGEDGTVEGRRCHSCSSFNGARIVEGDEAFVCDECGDAVDDGDEMVHILEHIRDAV